MAEIIIHDSLTLNAATYMSARLKTAEGLLFEVESIVRGAGEAGIDVGETMESVNKVSAAVVKGADAVNAAISKYTQGG